MADTIQIDGKTFVKYLSDAEIDAIEQQIADQINADYGDDEVLVLVNLNGALFFAAELLKKLHIKCRISCIKLSSYNGMESTNNVKNLLGLNEDLHGKRVLVLEDIIDTGCTYKHMVEMLKDSGMRDMRIAVLTYKPDSYKYDLPIHYVGKAIPNRYIIGHGFDYNGYARNLPDVYMLKEESLAISH